MIETENCISANDFTAEADDSAMIQSAIDTAKRTGAKSVVIAHRNARTGECIWRITRTIFLPSDFTLILHDAHLRMADGVICPMLCNCNVGSPYGNTQEGRQRNIHIRGFGAAVLDGGEPNGLSEFTMLKNGFPNIVENLTIFFHNVENFTIENIRIIDQRWWAIALMFCARGRIENIRFELTRHSLDSYAQWRNQDGIDLRVGCNNITIRAILGEVGDDLVAMTALTFPEFEALNMVDGESTDIHDILIEDIRGITNMCAIVRMLNHFGHRIYNITMRDITEISRPGRENKTQMAIRIGDPIGAYYRDDPAKRVRHGEIFNIHIENLSTRALSAIAICGTIRNFSARNIYLRDDGQHICTIGGFSLNLQPFIFLPARQKEIDAFHLVPDDKPVPTIIENFRLENIHYAAQSAHSTAEGALLLFHETEIRKAEIFHVCNDSDLPIFAYSGNCHGTVNIHD